jgi:hypothetical protein
VGVELAEGLRAARGVQAHHLVCWGLPRGAVEAGAALTLSWLPAPSWLPRRDLQKTDTRAKVVLCGLEDSLRGAWVLPSVRAQSGGGRAVAGSSCCVCGW